MRAVGELIQIEEFGSKAHNARPRTRDPLWYFADENYWKVEDSYPERLSIHIDILRGTTYPDGARIEAGRRRIEIRRFVRDMLSTDVVVRVEHMTHIRVYPHEKGRKRLDSRITHGYYHFYFEDVASAMHFKMRFPDWCRAVTQNHPDYPALDGYDDFFDENSFSRFQHDNLFQFV